MARTLKSQRRNKEAELSPSNMDICLVLVTHPNAKHAENIVRGAVEKGLAACVLQAPMASFYIWEDALTEDNEVVTLFKTVNEKVSLLENYVKSHHEYDVPAIIRVPAKADSAYGRWMNDALER
tara:strand:- start:1879 stop:2250 length:372 start_codon:yes stop_codon:yes gene_type:complete